MTAIQLRAASSTRELHALLFKLHLDFDDELVDDAFDRRPVERRKLDHRIQAIAKFRREEAPDRLHAVARVVRMHESNRRPAHLLCARIGRHDDDHVAEIGLAAVVVGKRAVVHDLQQQVEHIRVGLLDLIEQQHAMRMLGDRLGHEAALVKAHVARRRADQA